MNKNRNLYALTVKEANSNNIKTPCKGNSLYSVNPSMKGVENE
jgi:hypothetical protein